MSKKKKKMEKRNKSSVAFLLSDEAYDMMCISGYTPLKKRPEILAGVRTIAELISSMTIYLMCSGKNGGDTRIKNELSRKVDITPNRYMTRRTWMDAIVMNLILHGDGNSIVLPVTNQGYLEDLIVINPDQVMFQSMGYGYEITIGDKTYNPEDVLHFVLNPSKEYPWKGEGIMSCIKDVADNLEQASKTKKGFMQSKWKPSVIVKVDAMSEQFASVAGRKKIAEEYLQTGEAGEPWIIPGEQIQVEQIKPLSLADLAINDAVQLDKKTVAAVLGVPAFVLGAGEYKEEEWNGFINNKIRSFTQIIEQELTKKLLISPDLYWKFNLNSLYSYDLKTISEVYSDMYVRGIATGNEVRDKMSMSPKEGLDDLVILENYIPLNKIGDQLKLDRKEGNSDE